MNPLEKYNFIESDGGTEYRKKVWMTHQALTKEQRQEVEDYLNKQQRAAIYKAILDHAKTLDW